MKIVKSNITILFASFILSIINASAQQDKSLPDFNYINAGQTFSIKLYQANRNAIYIDTPNGNHITSEVNNGVLFLNADKKSTGYISVKIYFKELKGIELKGTAIASTVDTLMVSQFSVKTSSASNIKLVIKSEMLKVEADGASNVSLFGTSATSSFDFSGASSLKANQLVSQKVTIQTTGAANAKVNATDQLTAMADGASHIQFAGNPPLKNISVNGVATVNDKADGETFANDIINGIGKDGDTTRLKIGKKKFLIIEDDKNKKDEEYVEGLDETPKNARRKMKHVWSGFELGVNGLITPQMNFIFNDNYKFLNTKIGESWFFGLHFPELDGQIIRNKLAITTGLGIEWNNTHFDGNNYITPNVPTLASTADSSKLTLNKLYTFDITAPLLIKFAPGTKKSAKGGFHFATGVIFHYVTSASVVTETSANGYFQRTEFHDTFNINPFRIDATVRAGYSHLKLFANYSLTPYFNKSAAPDIRVFAAGLTLVGF